MEYHIEHLLFVTEQCVLGIVLSQYTYISIHSIYSIPQDYNCKELTGIEWLLSAGHHSKQLPCINSFNSFNSPMRQVCYCHSHFTVEETEAQEKLDNLFEIIAETLKPSGLVLKYNQLLYQMLIALYYIMFYITLCCFIIICIPVSTECIYLAISLFIGVQVLIAFPAIKSCLILLFTFANISSQQIHNLNYWT